MASSVRTSGPERILVSVSEGRRASRVTAAAACAARQFGARLWILHAIEADATCTPAEATGILEPMEDLERAEAWLRGLSRTISMDGVSARPLVVSGPVEEEIRGAIRSLGIDLLVIGRSRQRGDRPALPQRLGAVPCPLLVV